MKWFFRFLYQLSLSLWVGGMSCFAFLVTPKLFSELGRDQAAAIVGFLFPLYYPAVLAVSVVALLAYMTYSSGGLTSKLILGILGTAVLINGYQLLFLFPETADLANQIGSFEAMSKEHPLRKSFLLLHIQANILGLVVLIEGVVLMFFSSLKK